MAFSLNDVRLDGCLLGRPSSRDFRAVFHDNKFPDRVDLRPHCTPVENQGQLGSCTSNATVGAVEYQFCRRDGRSPDLSRLFVYYNARRIRGDVNEDSGAQIREAMASLVAFGVCREELWPYDTRQFTNEPTQEAYDDARGHEVIQYARVDGLQGAIAALAAGLPVVFGNTIPRRCYKEAATTGIIPPLTPEEREQVPTSGHAMLIVGYDQAERMLIVRNSWGEDWGDRGYCRIPYDVIEACSPPEEFWVVAELERQSAVHLIRPDRESTPSRPRVFEPAASGSMADRLRDQIRTSLDADLTAASRRIDAMLSGARGRAPQPPSPPVADGAPRADKALKRWKGRHFAASFPPDWSAVETPSGVDITGPDGISVVSSAYVTNGIVPSSLEEIRDLVLQGIGIANPRIEREGAAETTPYGTVRITEFTGHLNRTTVRGRIRATVFNGTVGCGYSACLRMAPADRWAGIAGTLEAIDRTIVVLTRRVKVTP